MAVGGIRWSRRALLVAGAVLIGSGTAALSWPERPVTAEVGSIHTAPDHPSSAGEPTDLRPSPARDAADGFRPRRLLVPALGIDAPLSGTLADADGALVPPDDPARLAWWRGVRPGAGAGSVLVAGHLDMLGYDQGPLARIVAFETGDRAVLTGADGTRAVYELRGVTTILKETLPAAELFGTDGQERLVLVTCGGAYDPDRRSWDSNVVAVLDPVRSD